MNKILDFSWSTAAVGGTKAATLTLPQDLFHPVGSTLVNVPLISRMAGYRYFRAGVKLRITVNATLFHSGKLMFTWMPFYRQGVGIDEVKNTSIYQASNNRPMILDVPSNSSLVMDIPWITPYQWIDLLRYVSLAGKWDAFIGSVDIWILHPLRNSSASAPSPSVVNVTVEAAFTDAEVSGFDPKQYLPLTADDFATCQMETIEKSAKGVVAGVRKDAQHVTHKISSIPIVGEALSKTLTTIVDSLGLDKPTSITAPQFVNHQLVPDFATGEGIDMSVPLSLDPMNRVATDPKLYSQGKELMDIYEIARTPSLIRILTFTSASATGAILHTECCDPMYCSPEFEEDGLFAPTYIAYVSYPFTYYTGGLKFFLQFTAPKTVTAKFRLSWTPTELTDTAQFELLGGEFPSRIIDITGSTQTEFTIPFFSPYSALPVTTFQRDTNPVFSNRKNNGFWQLTVLNPITGSTSATAVVDCAVWKAAAEDYRLFKPREITYHLTGDKERTLRESTEVTEDDSEDGDFATVQCDVWNYFTKQFTPIVPASYVTHEKVTEGEAYSNIRTLLHRFSFWQGENSSNTQTRRYPLQPLPGIVDGSPNMLHYFAQLYYFWRGSLRFKILYKQGPATTGFFGAGRVLLSTDNTPFDQNIDSAYNAWNGSTVYNTEYKPCTEFAVPWFSETLFFPVFNHNSPNSPVPPDDELSVGEFSIFQTQNNGTTLQTGPSYDIFVGVGDDFSLGFLSAPPMLLETSFTKVKTTINTNFGKKVTTTLRPSKALKRKLHFKRVTVK
jgi:hypothetical protein